MSVFDGITLAQVAQEATQKLIGLRDALQEVQDYYTWSSGLSSEDLQGLGMTADGAGDLLSAMADANALAQIYETGLPPGSYPQPASAYVYSASQARVIGPQ